MASKSKQVAAPPPNNIHRRGFASMSPKRRAEVAALGGVAAHKSGHARTFTPEEAAEAGRKGGKQRAKNMQQAMRAER